MQHKYHLRGEINILHREISTLQGEIGFSIGIYQQWYVIFVRSNFKQNSSRDTKGLDRFFDYSGLNVPLVAVCNVPPIAFSNVPPQKWLL